jgi:hypothetical protein
VHVSDEKKALKLPRDNAIICKYCKNYKDKDEFIKLSTCKSCIDCRDKRKSKSEEDENEEEDPEPKTKPSESDLILKKILTYLKASITSEESIDEFRLVIK